MDKILDPAVKAELEWNKPVEICMALISRLSPSPPKLMTWIFRLLHSLTIYFQHIMTVSAVNLLSVSTQPRQNEGLCESSGFTI